MSRCSGVVDSTTVASPRTPRHQGSTRRRCCPKAATRRKPQRSKEERGISLISGGSERLEHSSRGQKKIEPVAQLFWRNVRRIRRMQGRTIRTGPRARQRGMRQGGREVCSMQRVAANILQFTSHIFDIFLWRMGGTVCSVHRAIISVSNKEGVSGMEVNLLVGTYPKQRSTKHVQRLPFSSQPVYRLPLA